MYGLVNKALRDLLVSRHGRDVWNQVRSRAGMELDSFVALSPYPDELTERLLAAASELLGRTTDELLEDFGGHWITYTAQEGYGEMLELAGDSVVEFLENLDNLHVRVGLSFPELKPPSFRCTDHGDGVVRLHYYSSRRGLLPLVVGLLRGLGPRFQTTVDVTVDKRREDGHDHDELIVRYGVA